MQCGVENCTFKYLYIFLPCPAQVDIFPDFDYNLSRGDGFHFCSNAFAFSPGGSMFVVVFFPIAGLGSTQHYASAAFVFDVATREQIGVFRPTNEPHMSGGPMKAQWTPDGRRVLVSWTIRGDVGYVDNNCMYLWDFQRPPVEGDITVSATVIEFQRLHFVQWSSSGTTHYILRKVNDLEPATFALEERVNSTGEVVRAGCFLWTADPPGPWGWPVRDFPLVFLSPTAHAIVVPRCQAFPARIVRF